MLTPDVDEYSETFPLLPVAGAALSTYIAVSSSSIVTPVEYVAAAGVGGFAGATIGAFLHAVCGHPGRTNNNH